MIKNILSTFSTRISISFISLLIVIMTTRMLGAEGRGIISLIVITLNVILMFSSIVGGTALVFLSSRFSMIKLLIPSYIWSVITSISLGLVLGYFELFPSEYTIHIIILSVLFSFTTIHINLLLGKEKILHHNVLIFLQVLTLGIIFFIWVYIFNEKNVNSYVLALYISHILSAIISGILIIPYLGSLTYKTLIKDFKHISKYGLVAQAGNIFQTLNYRVSFYLLNIFTDAFAVGIYSVGVVISEALWMFGKSIAFVLYARICNLRDKNEAIKLTIVFSKISLIITLLIVIPFLIIPANVYALVFGEEFYRIKEIMIIMAAGIVALGVTSVYSSYFGGLGKYYINMLGSLGGLIVTIILCLLLIKDYGYLGAAIAASISFLCTSIYMLIVFLKITKTSVFQLLPQIKDFKLFWQTIKSFLKK